MLKDADHAEDRFKERLPGVPPELLVRARAAESKIPPDASTRMHVPLRHEGKVVGYAAYKRVGEDRRPVLATILGPNMTPRKSHTLSEDILSKAAALKHRLAPPVPSPNPFLQIQGWYAGSPEHGLSVPQINEPSIEHKKTAGTKTRLFSGLRVRIDRPKGFVQKGKDPSGKPWERVYQCDYGYLAGTQGGDGDGLDVFLGPDESQSSAWLIRQVDKNGRFDEFKLMLGFKTKEAAREMYLKHVPLRFLGSMEEVNLALLQGLTGRPVDHTKVGFAKHAADQAMLRAFDSFLR